MWNCPTEPKIRAGGHQHQIVRTRCDRRDKRKDEQRYESLRKHGAIITLFMINEIAFLRKNHYISQYMAKLDQINQKILRELSANARISNLDLADRVGLSPSACLRRVQELEKSGVIAGYRVRTDPAKLGLGFTAYITVGLSKHSKASQEAFERAMEKADEVIECHNITGSVEYLLRIEASDLTAYKAFHTDVLGTLPDVNALTTYVVMGSPKDQRA